MKLVKSNGKSETLYLPGLDYLRSDRLTVSLTNRDFAPPALTNQWASVVTGRDFLSYAGFAAPPLYSDGVQAEVFLAVEGDMKPGAGMDSELTYVWYPDRVERECSWQGVDITSRTAVSVRANAVLNELKISNPDSRAKTVDLFVRFLADFRTDWQGKPSARIAYDSERGVLILTEDKSGASARIGGSVRPHGFATFGEEDDRFDKALANLELDGHIAADDVRAVFHYRFEVGPNGQCQLRIVHVLDQSYGDARAAYRDHQNHFEARFEEIAREWEKEWEAAFTPGNGRFSGHLPILDTDHEKVKRLYYMSVMNMLYCKRTRRFGTPGFVYATGLPSSSMTFAITSSFLWDAMMVSGLLAMLDPDVLRYQMEDWMESDIHKGYGIDFLSGRPLGFWYAVNDYALIHMANQYLRYTGDLDWLDKKIRGLSVFEHLVESASYWKHIAAEDGLADYGEKENLLECVSTYIHKVASFNSANVWNARTVADFADIKGAHDIAAMLREQASHLAAAVNTLYIDGEGYWNCKQPDGSMIPVRHCLDFFTVMQCMHEDLSDRQRKEMVQFFLRELKTSTWMHALSPKDPDTAYSSRTDHQDDGAYTTWPAYSLQVLVQNGYLKEALDWIGSDDTPGLADVTRQGPFGQAYYHGDDDSPTIAGAAAKAPMEWPHIEKPVLISGGKYAEIVIEDFAGLNPCLAGEVTLLCRSLPFRLKFTNILLRGENHDLVSDTGTAPQEASH